MASPTEGLLIDPFDFYDDRWPLVRAGDDELRSSMRCAKWAKKAPAPCTSHDERAVDG